MVHSQYNNTIDGSDIALIRLKEPVSLTPYVKPICLPVEKNIFLNESETLQVMGFGKTEKKVFPDALLKIAIPFVPIEKCNKFYYKAIYGTMLRKGQMCAGFKAEKKKEKVRDACQQDSGGPLVALKANFRGIFKFVQIGIVSFGISCGKFPGVYTSVSSFMDWIADNIEP